MPTVTIEASGVFVSKGIIIDVFSLYCALHVYLKMLWFVYDDAVCV
jgi:hypothetical protein